MGTHRATAVGLTVLAYVIVTFAVQGASHFWINADHYAGISFLRPVPIVPLGMAATLIQGLVFALLYPAFIRSGTIRDGVTFSWALGAFLASYPALAEAGKYTVPEIGPWLVVEASAAAVQYTVFGLLLGLIYSRVRAGAAVHQTA